MICCAGHQKTIKKSSAGLYRFGYQGQFSEYDDETGWNSFELRMYDSKIGRWMVPDPARQYYSPYVAFGNNPISRIDPDGGTDNPFGEPLLDLNVDPGPGSYYDIQTGNMWTDLYGGGMVQLNFLFPVDINSFPDQSSGGSYIGPYSPTYNRMNTGSGYSDALGWGVTGFGAYAGARELSLVRDGAWKGANGTWNSLKWGGNGATGARSNVLSNASTWKVAGRAAFIGGVVISGAQFINNPTLDQGVQSGTDITMGAVGAYGGPVGWGASGVYFLDQFLRSVSPAYERFQNMQGELNRRYGSATYVGSDGIYVCFTASTLIYTENGLKPIEQLKEGIKVYSYNFATDSVELQPITKFFTREAREIYEIIAGSEQINVTAEHPFYVQGKEWVRVKDLVPGDRLQSGHGREVEISGINKNSITVMVYNIEVAGNHNYFVTSSKVLVHNKSIVELEDEKTIVENQSKAEQE